VDLVVPAAVRVVVADQEVVDPELLLLQPP
jgi:hypothetical protein